MLNRKGRKVGHNPSSWNTKTVFDTSSGVISSRREATLLRAGQPLPQQSPGGPVTELKPGPSASNDAAHRGSSAAPAYTSMARRYEALDLSDRPSLQPPLACCRREVEGMVGVLRATTEIVRCVYWTPEPVCIARSRSTIRAAYSYITRSPKLGVHSRIVRRSAQGRHPHCGSKTAALSSITSSHSTR